jgi:hypothetical protein
MSKPIGLIVFGAALAISQTSIAQTATPSQSQPSTTAQTAGPDMNEVVCERQEVTGSRLARKKVCMTRAQWADSRLQDRQATEKVQLQGRVQGE